MYAREGGERSAKWVRRRISHQKQLRLNHLHLQQYRQLILLLFVESREDWYDDGRSEMACYRTSLDTTFSDPRERLDWNVPKEAQIGVGLYFAVKGPNFLSLFRWERGEISRNFREIFEISLIFRNFVEI